MHDEKPADSERLREDNAHRLFTRAIELDTSHGSELTVAQLRDAAREAGISLTAFDAALREWSNAGAGSAHAAESRARRPKDRFLAWVNGGWSKLAGDVADIGVLRNVVALAAFWGLFTLLVTIDRAAGVHWLVRKATDPLALALGAAIAARLKARPIALLLGGLAISQGAEFLMDAVLGGPAVQGFGSHWALMIAGVAGVLVGARVFPWSRGGALGESEKQPASTDEVPEPPFASWRALVVSRSL